MHRTLRDIGAAKAGTPTWTSASSWLNPGRRSHFEKENFLDAPRTSRQPSSHSRGGRRAKVFGGTQLVVHDTKGIDASNQIHAGFKHLQTISGMATTPGERSQSFSKCGIEPLNEGGIEHASPTGGCQEGFSLFKCSLSHAPDDLDHALLCGAFDDGALHHEKTYPWVRCSHTFSSRQVFSVGRSPNTFPPW